jgi:hypothetical protein
MSGLNYANLIIRLRQSIDKEGFSTRRPRIFAFYGNYATAVSGTKLLRSHDPQEIGDTAHRIGRSDWGARLRTRRESPSQPGEGLWTERYHGVVDLPIRSNRIGLARLLP